MSHRRRGVLFAMASICAAAIAASAVARQEQAIEAEQELRAVLVAGDSIGAGTRLRDADLEVRRFPVAYVPPEALVDPVQVLGREPAIEIPRGAYLLPAFFARPEGRTQTTGLPPGLTPVQLPIAGAGPVASLAGSRVDVLVTRDSPSGLGGRTSIAVADARLESVARRSPGDAVATLVVRRPEALLLIEAASYAREIRLIAAAGG